jgi:hypothetical protein
LPLPKKNCADRERGWAVRVGKALIILEGTLGDGDVASFALLLPVASERNGVSRNRTRDKKSPPKKARQMIDVTKTKCKSDITKKKIALTEQGLALRQGTVLPAIDSDNRALPLK